MHILNNMARQILSFRGFKAKHLFRDVDPQTDISVAPDEQSLTGDKEVLVLINAHVLEHCASHGSICHDFGLLVADVAEAVDRDDGFSGIPSFLISRLIARPRRSQATRNFLD